MTANSILLIGTIMGSVLTFCGTVVVCVINIMPARRNAQTQEGELELKREQARDKAEADRLKAKDDEIAAQRTRIEKLEGDLQEEREAFLAWREARLKPYEGTERRGQIPPIEKETPDP